MTAFHVRHDVGFLVGQILHAVFGHLNAADPDFQFIPNSLLTRLANGHDNAPPIGVFTGNRGFNKRRIGNRHGNLVGRLVVLGSRQGDLDQLFRTLTIPGHLQCKIVTNRIERFGEGFQTHVSRRPDVRHFALGTRCKQQHRIRRRRIAINRNAIEGLGHRGRQQRLQCFRRNRSISKNKHQHRCHVGCYHARAFGDALDGHRVLAELGFRNRSFGKSIRGHDGIGRIRPLLRRCGGFECRKCIDNKGRIERLANHTR